MENKLNEAKKVFAQHVKNLQDAIVGKMKEVDPDLEIQEDLWERKDFAGNPGGGGRTRALRGKVFENAGVNFSEVYGEIDPKFAQTLGGTGHKLWASGISLIIHPYNPRVPTVHANFRMINHGDAYWFGGGADLTPFYPYPEDFKYFHQVWKDACAPYDCYEWMKKECDQYFVNKHRDNEMRGISGIFFDHFKQGSLEDDMKMVKDLSEHFIKSYFPIVEKRKDESWNLADENFQLYRRGRYVEFNLIHDRGTLFGLKTNGRTESILISLPARCHFQYGYQVEAGTPYAEMMEYYRPKDW